MKLKLVYNQKFATTKENLILDQKLLTLDKILGTGELGVFVSVQIIAAYNWFYI